MASFAPVCPAKVAQYLKDQAVLGPYNLLLAHDVADPENKALYNEVFSPADFWNYTERITILDNSVVELGDAVNVEMIAEAAFVSHANVIVLPDVLLDTKATIDRTLSALDTWTPILKEALPWKWTYMAVPQTTKNVSRQSSIEHFVTCLEQFHLNDKDRKIGWLGIPRNLVSQGWTRSMAVQLARTISNRQIHLLGFSEDIVDDMFTVRHSGVDVRGIDSAVPLRAATKGIAISLNTTDAEIGPRGNWWNDVEPNSLMVKNLNKVRNWLR